MEEEQRFEEGHLFGSPATLDLCSKCYREHCVEEERRRRRQIQDSAAGKVAAENSRQTLDPSIANSSAIRAEIAAVADQAEEVERKEGRAAAGPRKFSIGRERFRYVEQHGCSFDFKAAGRGAISRANPVVKADELRKI
ncbi:zinc finger A20 and AN1 domain-containing stress-associated protein 5-like [Curcuma longa]|uniref:zinc finger A20 and AN1 domain-containing stress-associated protein 5-like n=1 Tax=Curcuma longa TaxID=136217 RepID=UPI003D9DDBAC